MLILWANDRDHGAWIRHPHRCALAMAISDFIHDTPVAEPAQHIPTLIVAIRRIDDVLDVFAELIPVAH